MLIFDGLDELRNSCNCMAEESRAGNDNNLIMPISVLFIKLVKGLLLPSAMILTTTRPTGVEKYSGLQFARKVEILGLTVSKIQDYVERFCKKETDMSHRIWDHIKCRSNLLHLLYSSKLLYSLFHFGNIHQIRSKKS